MKTSPAAKDPMAEATSAAARIDADVYLYNGPLVRGRDFTCVESIASHQSRERVVLLLTTHGGDPDAAYKIARFLQEKYKHITVLVSGLCKSAGTLIALGAHELAFTPTGELGPLDVQMTKIDRFEQMQSGLVITESLNTLEERAKEAFYGISKELIDDNQGLISFASAAKAASELTIGLYAPILSRVDPEEVGARARAMRIASDYGQRLSKVSKNLKTETLRLLAETYSSHSFVIDKLEADSLFNHVRWATPDEAKLAQALGSLGRSEIRRSGNVLFLPLSEPAKKSVGSSNHEQPKDKHDKGNHGGDPARATRQTGAQAATPANGSTRGKRQQGSPSPSK